MAALIDNFISVSAKDGAQDITTPAFAVGGNNRVLYALAYSGAGSPTACISGKWGGSGGVAMTQVSITQTIGTYGTMTLWRLINPIAQTATAYFDWGVGQDERLVIVVSVKDCNQVTPNNTIAAAISSLIAPTINATALVGDLVISFVGIMDDRTDAKTLTPTETLIVKIDGIPPTLDGYEDLGASYTTALTTSQAMTWTVSGVALPETNWAGIYAFAVNGAAAVVPGYYHRSKSTIIDGDL